MELRKVAVGLEYVEEVQCELHRLLVIISERSRNCAKERLMTQHDLHVLVVEAEVEDGLGAPDLLLNLLLVKQLNVIIEHLNIDARVVYSLSLLLNGKKGVS